MTRPLETLGLFETHLPVADLARSTAFYERVLGLETAHHNEQRQVTFLWVGGPVRTMLGLWAGSQSPTTMRMHLSFRVDLATVLGAIEGLRRHSVEPLDLWGRPTTEPSVIAWVPAASVFFHDPDGHFLELLAPLEAPARPEAGNVTMSEWQARWALEAGVA